MIAPARLVPLDLSAAFTHFRNADPERLHFAAHSHHFWPDVARDAHIKAWDDAARLADDKWGDVLNSIWRAAISLLSNTPTLCNGTSVCTPPGS
jgi:kynureninase